MTADRAAMTPETEEAAYESGGVLVVPWRITDPLDGYVPRIGDPVVERRPYAHLGEIIELQTPEQFAALPDGTVLISISGEEKVKGRDDIDLDTRFGRIAWGLPDRRLIDAETAGADAEGSREP